MTSVNRFKYGMGGSAALAALLLLFGLAACSPSEPEEWTLQGPIMGTYYVVKIVPQSTTNDVLRLDSLGSKVIDALNEVDGLMSTYKPESELSRFNAQESTEPFSFSPLTLEVLEMAQQVSRESQGAFDVTVGPLVNAYGFGPEAVEGIPSDERIAELREWVGFERLSVDRAVGFATKEHPKVYVDLSAIAKGYAVDRVAEALEAAGQTDFMVEVGGEVRAKGVNKSGQPWRIAIEQPTVGARASHRVIPLRDYSMATSGDYRNFVLEEGKRLSHTIDPRTGRPVGNHLASATVLHASCALADAYATVLMVLGETEGYAFAETHDLAVFLIYHDGEGFAEKTSPAFDAFEAAATAP